MTGWGCNFRDDDDDDYDGKYKSVNYALWQMQLLTTGEEEGRCKSYIIVFVVGFYGEALLEAMGDLVKIREGR